MKLCGENWPYASTSVKGELYCGSCACKSFQEYCSCVSVCRNNLNLDYNQFGSCTKRNERMVASVRLFPHEVDFRGET